MKRRLRGDLIGDFLEIANTLCFDPVYTRVLSECKKSAHLPIKGDGSTLVKGIDF
jgi:hypothetical protein